MALRDIPHTSRHPTDFGLKWNRNLLAGFAELSVCTPSVRRAGGAQRLPEVAVVVRKEREPAPPRPFERCKPSELRQTDITSTCAGSALRSP